MKKVPPRKARESEGKEIELGRYGLPDLLLTAIRSEIDSFQLYFKLSRTVQNVFLREKLDFLAAEETKHKEHLQKMFQDLSPGQALDVPEKALVPLPSVQVKDELMPLGEILAAAMQAEAAAAQFYRQVAGKFFSREEEATRRNLLLYLSAMEDGHYKLLDLERENVLRLEEFGQEQEMVHVGP